MNHQLKFFLNLAKVQAGLTRRFDRGLNGLGLTEFAILYSLSRAKEGRLSRIELAEQVGLTASGVTRILLPMEKVGLIKRQLSADDARVSYVALASGGKTKLEESLQRAEVLSQDLMPALVSAKKLEELAELLKQLKLGQ